MKQEIINYIEKGKKQGFSAERIKDALLKAGYTEKTANEHLNYVYKETVNKSNKGKIIIISLIILIIILGSGFYYYFKVIPENNLQNYMNYGWNLYNKGDFEGAIEQFNKAVILDPENEIIYRVLGWSYYHLGKYEEAIEQFNKAVILDPENEIIYRVLGWSYYHLGKYEEAIEQFNKAVILDSENEILYRGLGWSYYYLEDYEGAIENFEKAISINEDFDDLYGFLGASYYSLEKYDQAIENFEKAIGLYPENDKFYVGLALCYYQTGNYEDALNYLTKAENINELTFSTKLVKGSILIKLKEYEKAEELLNGLKEYKEEESYCGLWMVISILEFEKGQTESSKENYYKAFEINPDCRKYRGMSRIDDELRNLLKL